MYRIMDQHYQHKILHEIWRIKHFNRSMNIVSTIGNFTYNAWHRYHTSERIYHCSFILLRKEAFISSVCIDDETPKYGGYKTWIRYTVSQNKRNTCEFIINGIFKGVGFHYFIFAVIRILKEYDRVNDFR